MRHIEYLLEIERTTRDQYGGKIRFDRVNDNTICVSCAGYKHMDLYVVHKALLGMKLRYNFKLGIETFDQTSGRTYSYFSEPKGLDEENE